MIKSLCRRFSAAGVLDWRSVTSGNSRDDARNVPAVSDVDTGVDEDRGTKSYHCVIPGLSSVGTSSEVGSSVSGATTNYQEEKRKRRAADRASRGHRRE